MGFTTVLTPTAGVPGRSYGAFSGKGTANPPPATPGDRSGTFTALTPTAGLPGRRYGSFAGKGEAVTPPTPTPTPATPSGAGPGLRRRKRAIVDGRLVEGERAIRQALAEWTERIDRERATPKDAPKKRVKTKRSPVEVPPSYTLSEAEVETFATALRAIEAREAEVKAFLAEWRARIDEDEAWLLMQ